MAGGARQHAIIIAMRKYFRAGPRLRERICGYQKQRHSRGSGNLLQPNEPQGAPCAPSTGSIAVTSGCPATIKVTLTLSPTFIAGCMHIR